MAQRPNIAMLIVRAKFMGILSHSVRAKFTEILSDSVKCRWLLGNEDVVVSKINSNL